MNFLTPKTHEVILHQYSPFLLNAAYLSVDPEGTALLLQLDGRDTRHLPRLLDVGTVGTDGEAHQILPHPHLLLVC